MIPRPVPRRPNGPAVQRRAVHPRQRQSGRPVAATDDTIRRERNATGLTPCRLEMPQARRRRASERPRVRCNRELGGPVQTD